MNESLLLDELFSDIGEVAEDTREAMLSRGQTIRLHVKVEKGGPFELLIVDPIGEILKIFSGISQEHQFELAIPKNGYYGFAFQSVGYPGAVHLKVSLKP